MTVSKISYCCYHWGNSMIVIIISSYLESIYHLIACSLKLFMDSKFYLKHFSSFNDWDHKLSHPITNIWIVFSLHNLIYKINKTDGISLLSTAGWLSKVQFRARLFFPTYFFVRFIDWYATFFFRIKMFAMNFSLNLKVCRDCECKNKSRHSKPIFC